MPGKTFEIFVEPISIPDLLMDLYQIDGIEVRLPTQELSKPDVEKISGSDEMGETPSLHIEFAELAPVIICISGTATALTSLAAAILNYKSAKINSTEKQNSPKAIIKVEETIIEIENFADPEKLADYINKILNNQNTNKSIHVQGNIIMNDFKNNSINQSHFGSGDNVARDKNTNHNYNNSQDLPQAAAEIQTLLEQLEKTYPTNSTDEKMEIATKAIQHINNNPKLASKILSALRSGGISALDSLLDHPAASFVIGALEDWKSVQ